MLGKIVGATVAVIGLFLAVVGVALSQGSILDNGAFPLGVTTFIGGVIIYYLAGIHSALLANREGAASPGTRPGSAGREHHAEEIQRH